MEDAGSANLLRDTAKLADFFGCSLKKVDETLIRIARLRSPPPDWLKGKAKMSALPRYSSKAAGDQCVVALTGKGYAERLVWLVENLEHDWRSSKKDGTATFVLAETDATHFRLRWGTS